MCTSISWIIVSSLTYMVHGHMNIWSNLKLEPQRLAYARNSAKKAWSIWRKADGTVCHIISWLHLMQLHVLRWCSLCTSLSIGNGLVKEKYVFSLWNIGKSEAKCDALPDTNEHRASCFRWRTLRLSWLDVSRSLTGLKLRPNFAS